MFLLTTYLICVGFGLMVPEQFHMHEAWASLVPGFEWLTWPVFIAGTIGGYLYESDSKLSAVFS